MRVRGGASGDGSGGHIMDSRSDLSSWYSVRLMWCVSASDMSVQRSGMVSTEVRSVRDRCVFGATIVQLHREFCHPEVGRFSSKPGPIDREASKLVIDIQV